MENLKKVGRNDICPCGSGKKYKNCCGKTNVISMEQLIDKDLMELQVNMIQFAMNHFSEEIEEVLEEQFETIDIPNEAFELFHFYTLTWFITSIEVDGKTIMSHYIDQQKAKLTRQRVKDILQSWRKAKPTISLITEQDQDDQQLLTLKDIFTDEVYRVKVLDEEHPVETGGIVLSTILPAGEHSIFFTTFIDLPASLTNMVVNRVMNMMEGRDRSQPDSFVAQSFPEILHLFLFGIEPTIEDFNWISPKHKEVALEFEDYVEEDVLLNLGVHLWHQYCLQRNPKIMKTSVYTAALLYLIDQFNPFGGYTTQKELADDFAISVSSLSTRYKDMEAVLEEEIHELEEKLATIDLEEVYDDLFDEDDLFDKEDDNSSLFAHSGVPMERELHAIQNNLEKTSFSSQDEANSLLKKQRNHSQGPQRELTNKEKAQELLFDAYEATGKRRKQLAEKALKLYPNSPGAYSILAEFELNPLKEEKLLLKAVEAGEKELGEDFFKENAGHFWGIFHTRPYMRAKYDYAEFLHSEGRLTEAIQHYEELLELNPNDNQGVRYELFTVLVEKGLLDQAAVLLNTYKEEMTANGAYNRVLLEFLQNGATSKAKQLLQKALKKNPYVSAFLLEEREIPMYLPNGFELGKESEAIIYADQHFDLWRRNKKLMSWLKKSR
ncbi:tetratricopeptide repeat protein [Bacillus tuaregi]|uniref:tetratricopeptide repeat protein n=1 Tax=Bacillus tuaregi TaxID=1816695 RepID=UPI0008F81C56|nr:tetratricopeptide repeat protein [Bacillus tuaregi]